MNPRAAINDLHPFQGCPFSHLGYISRLANSYFHYYRIKDSVGEDLQRRGWDSNPRALADKRFSRPPRYDHFDTSPCSRRTRIEVERKDYSSKNKFSCQPVFLFFHHFEAYNAEEREPNLKFGSAIKGICDASAQIPLNIQISLPELIPKQVSLHHIIP